MKIPRSPPNIRLIEEKLSPSRFRRILEIVRRTPDKYPHWDIVRHLSPPGDLTIEEWWLGIMFRRSSAMKTLPLLDAKGGVFHYQIPDKIVEQLHEIDLCTGIPEPILNPHTKNQYLVSSLIHEAITSSQLEGAATTRAVAKEMLRSGRAPRDKNEQMILNNFLTMQKIESWKDRPLDIDLIFEIHRLITDQTLDKLDGAGRLRREEENVAIIDAVTDEILYYPPPANELPERLRALCDFANEKTPDHFIHPMIRAIILHFWLAYDHPFIDGNGRTARALFYWLMMRKGYWIFEYSSISSILLQAPAQYVRSFLYTETDNNDLTYFILHQTEVIQKALLALNQYIETKTKELGKIETLLRAQAAFNSRQEALLAHAMHHPHAHYTVEAHKNSHDVAYDTARKDLLDLHHRGLLEMRKRGKAFIFTIPHNLPLLLNTL